MSSPNNCCAVASMSKSSSSSCCGNKAEMPTTSTASRSNCCSANAASNTSCCGSNSKGCSSGTADCSKESKVVNGTVAKLRASYESPSKQPLTTETASIAAAAKSKSTYSSVNQVGSHLDTVSSSHTSLLSDDAHTVCNLCDSSSPVAHTLSVSRIRIANLCCSGEEKIIRTCLESFKGIDKIDVNIIGRYIVVKHCKVDCCAPVSAMIASMNEKKLGASIQDSAMHSDNEGEDVSSGSLYSGPTGHCLLVWMIFLLGVMSAEYLGDSIYTIAIYLLCTVIGAIPIVSKALLSFSRNSIDINVLMLLAITGAMISDDFIDSALLTTLFLTAEAIEDIVLAKVRKAVNMSSGRVPSRVSLVDGKSIPIEEVHIGDHIAVRAGEVILADGVIIRGEGVLDESSLTGEAIPINKRAGDRANSGTIVQNGYLEISVDTAFENRTIQKLHQAVMDVQADKGEIGRIVDQFAAIWTPTVLLIASGVFVIGGYITGLWSEYLHKGLVMLVLACPCALVIAAPIPSVCTIASAARNGVLVRGSSVIEEVAIVSAVAADKTGTLTKGHFVVHARLVMPNATDANYDPLQLAAALEERSSHPVSNAIVSAYCGCIAEMADDLPQVKKLKNIDGVGVEGWVEVDKDWLCVSVGNERLLKTNGGRVHISKTDTELIKSFLASNVAMTVIYVCVEDELAMLLALTDEVRPDANAFIRQLTQQGLASYMLTGDHKDVATKVADEIGIDASNCHYRLKPQDKLAWIAQLKSTYPRGVVMIGDGINDSIALAAANVGVAMGVGGTAMAAAAANIVLMSDKLLKLPQTIEVCRHTRNIIFQNCAIAIGTKVLACVYAVFGKLAFWQAVLIDIGTLLVVIANGTRPLSAFDNHKSESKQDSNGFDNRSKSDDSAEKEMLIRSGNS